MVMHGCFMLPVSMFVSALQIFLVIFTLLIIGNVEINPGPQELSDCSWCGFKAKTSEEHIHHQTIHSGNYNFQYRCPFSSCHHKYAKLKSVSAHLSHHSVARTEVVGETSSYTCAYCSEKVSTNCYYCKHLKKHLKEGVSVTCPLGNCSRTIQFTSINVFGTHLSQCHGGWRQDYGRSALPGFVDLPLDSDTNIPSSSRYPDNVFMSETYHGETPAVDPVDVEDQMSIGGFSNEDDSESCSSDSFRVEYDYDQIELFIAQMYAMLEGKLLVPTSTIDIIARRLAFISGIARDNMKDILSKSLTSAGVEEEMKSRIIEAVASADTLYNVHHTKNALGPCFLTDTRRTSYFKKKFKYQEAVKINLKKNPEDLEDTEQYVDVRESLRVMLEDPSVQKCIDESFTTTPSDGSIIRDYTDGSVFKESGTPMKRIDLLLYMDAFNCANPLGSAKNKYKMNAMYMTLGNFKPFMRSMLKSMRLILLVNDKSLKKTEKMFKKCFKRVMVHLKELELDGIMYKGENVVVRVQFVQGDNLGQHTIGGLIESFTGNYFCRFCEMLRENFLEDQETGEFREAAWRTPDSFQTCLRRKESQRLENYKGVKRDSPLHQLKYFKVFQPRLAPCIGHDLFIGGVADHDLAVMINHFISQGWISLRRLNNKVNKFKFTGVDSRNKPAPFNGGKKLGGHAVQNWTFIRYLPFFMGKKVKTEDPTWNLFLLLKETLEYVCAPALSSEQIEYMRSLINRYLKERKILDTKYRPKHHFFSHYADLYILFGPLIYLWTLAFEHRHQYFKRVAQICKNFINLGHTLVEKYLLLQAYQSSGIMFPDGPIVSESSNLQDDNFEENVHAFIDSCQFSSSALSVQSMHKDEISYKKEDWLLLSKSSPGKIFMGQIKAIVIDGEKCQFIVQKHEAEKWEEYGLYAVSSICELSVMENFDNPCPHPVYEFKNQQCVSLKHIFWN